MAKLHIRPDVVKGHINPDIFLSILDAAFMRVFT